MKKMISLVMVCLVIFAFAGCEVVTEQILVGTWKSQANVLGLATDVEYTFNEDGTGSMSAVMGVGLAMKYTVEEDVLTIVTDTPILQKTYVYTYSFEGDTLVLTNEEGTIRLVKI